MSKTETLGETKLQLTSKDGTSLFVRRLQPQGLVRARLLWVHGFAEHSGRYLETLGWFAARGFDCWMLDLRGHGRSEGRRTHVERFSDYLDDVEAFHQHVDRAVGNDRPRFALGHSMGGLVLTRTLQQRFLPPLAGAVILSPFLGVKVELPGWKVFAARSLSRFVPTVSLPSDLDLSLLSKDPAVWEAYDQDPLVVKSATARWYTETVRRAQPAALAAAPQLSLPALVQHGREDGIADPAATEHLFASLGSADKELKLWDGLRHELLNEVEKEQVRGHILGWLEPRL
jgi:alpha-beta hydrolase superfamily lysophospholipase